MENMGNTLELRRKSYSPAYRAVLDAAVKLAAQTEDGLLTPALLFRTLLRTHEKEVARLLGRKCSYPEIAPVEENNSGEDRKVFFSSETDRYLSLYGGVMSEIVKIFGHEVELDAIHIAAALLWDPEGEVKEFLNFNGFDSDSAVFRRQLEAVLTDLDAKDQKRLIKARSAQLKSKLRNIRRKLEAVCFGQDAAIRTVITQLAQIR